MRTRLITTTVLAVALLSSLPTGAQSLDASCSLTFDGTWSSETHPQDFPLSAHFSPLIGATHTDAVSFWQPGVLATSGVQRVAELGETFGFENEVGDAIAAGSADQTLFGGSLVSPGSRSFDFDAVIDYPLLTLITMIAPSPDWFVGVHGLPLFENGAWIQSQVAVLPAYDAGTDSGTSYKGNNIPTSPRAVIARLTGFPLPAGDPPFGLFTIDCTSDLVFLGGFESGDASSWTQPAG